MAPVQGNDSPLDQINTRSYQQEMLEASLRDNIIVAQDTGSGKTHIAVLRMKVECDRQSNKVSLYLLSMCCPYPLPGLVVCGTYCCSL